MLRYKTETEKLDLVYSPCTTSGQETERVNSYNPGARTGLHAVCLTKRRNSRSINCLKYSSYTEKLITTVSDLVIHVLIDYT